MILKIIIGTLLFAIGFIIGLVVGEKLFPSCKHKRKYPMYSRYYCPDCENLID